MLKQVCGYCGKEFIDNPAGYENCVISCGREYKRKAEEQRLQDMAKRLDSDKKALEAKRNAYVEAEKEFIKNHPNESVERYVAPGWTVSVLGPNADRDFLRGLETYFKNHTSMYPWGN